MKRWITAAVACFFSAAVFAVDVNTATEAELDGVKGIGSSVAQRILQERANGKFSDWNDFIKRVKGIGEKNATKFSADGLTVNGRAFTPSAESAKTKADEEDKKASADKSEVKK